MTLFKNTTGTLIRQGESTKGFVHLPPEEAGRQIENINTAFSKIVSGLIPEPNPEEAAAISPAIRRMCKRNGSSDDETRDANEIYNRMTNPDLDDPVYDYDRTRRFEIAIFELACCQANLELGARSIEEIETRIRSSAGSLVMQALQP